MTTVDPADALRRRIESASEGLVYSSEGDHPFRFVDCGPAPDWPVSPRRFATLVGADPDVPVEEWDLDEFFARHVERVDPLDREGQALRPRYDQLRSELRKSLGSVRVFRVGRVRVRCFVVGAEPATGRLIGLETLAIET